MMMDLIWRAGVAGLLVLGSGLFVPAEAGGGASEWSEGLHARTRLVMAGSVDAETRRAGIEIRLDDGFKTYWRTPGSSGVPPTFDFSQSRNLKAAKVLFPTPLYFPDGVDKAIGYKHEVILPVRVQPQNPAMPVELVLKMDYAVCDKLCVPVQASVTLTVAAKGPVDQAIAAQLAAFETRVPKRIEIGAPGPLAVLGVQGSDKDGYAVSVRAPAGVTPQLFVEGQTGWYFDIAGGEPDGDLRRYVLKLAEKPSGDNSSKTSALITVATPDQATETEVTLPVSAKQ